MVLNPKYTSQKRVEYDAFNDLIPFSKRFMLCKTIKLVELLTYNTKIANLEKQMPNNIKLIL